MKQNTLIEIISDQTQRMLWEVNNVIDCVPNSLWNKEYCDMPLWKHIYHMLHSLDLWFIILVIGTFVNQAFIQKT